MVLTVWQGGEGGGEGGQGGQRRAHQVIRGFIVIDLKINDKESIYYLYNTVHELVGQNGTKKYMWPTLIG